MMGFIAAGCSSASFIGLHNYVTVDCLSCALKAACVLQHILIAGFLLPRLLQYTGDAQ